MKKTITCGRVRQLLEELGFTHWQVDDRFDGYHEKTTDMFFALPRWPDEAVARDSEVSSLRVQLSYRGLLDEADFEAALAEQPKVKS